MKQLIRMSRCTIWHQVGKSGLWTLTNKLSVLGELIGCLITNIGRFLVISCSHQSEETVCRIDMLLKVVEYNGTHMDVDLLGHPEGEFHTGVAAAVFVTVMSEMGDKSFFLSAILAMHHSRTLTFFGSVLGQALMTLVAVSLGMVASLVPAIYTKWVSCLCMTFFGLKMLKDGCEMAESEELEEENEENKNESEGALVDQNDNTTQIPVTIDEKKKEKSIVDDKEQEDGTLQICEVTTSKSLKVSSTSSRRSSRRDSKNNVLIQAFTLSCLGEWGDRSQIATIVLATNENPLGVAVGSIFGHIVCSLTAVIGGRLLGQKFPVKTMTQAGGVVFLLCAASAIVFE